MKITKWTAGKPPSKDIHIFDILRETEVLQ